MYLPPWSGRPLTSSATVLSLLATLAACSPVESDSVESDVFLTHVGDEGAGYVVEFVAGGADDTIESGVALVLLDDYRDHAEDPIVVDFTCDFGKGPSPSTRDIRTRHGEVGFPYPPAAWRSDGGT